MTQAPASANSIPVGRRHDLDAIRIGAFALLILYHVGMFYVPWDWHVDSQRPQDWLIPVMEISSPWRLTLLFLVSGAATRLLYGAYQRQGAGAEERLAGSRLLRLGLPLLFGMAVIVPPQTYFEVVQHVRNNALAVDIYNNALTADFWQRYLTASGQWCDENGCIITPTWNHLWFVTYALFYGLLAPLIVGGLKSRMAAITRAFEQVFSSPALLIVPVIVLAALRLWLAPLFPATHNFVMDPYVHAVSLAPMSLALCWSERPR